MCVVLVCVVGRVLTLRVLTFVVLELFLNGDGGDGGNVDCGSDGVDSAC